jgi:hypothetical protein
MSESLPRYEYRVLYRRRWWREAKARYYQLLPPALRLLEKLRYPDHPEYDHLEPIVELRVQRRVVGEWETSPVRLIDAYHDVDEAVS